MNSTEHDIIAGLIAALKGLGVLGLLRLLWAGLVKLAAWWPNYAKGEKQTALDVRKVILDENKAAQAAHDAQAARVQASQTEVDDSLFALVATFKTELARVGEKVDRLEMQLAAAVEAGAMAKLSTEAAHLRADEIDRDRAKAVLEVADLKVQNTTLKALLAEADARLQQATASSNQDRARIEQLTRDIESNRARIDELTQKLAAFEHGSFTMKPGTVELTHIDAPGEEL